MEKALKALEGQSSSIVAQATSIKVDDGATYAVAGEMLIQIKACKKTVTDYFSPMKNNAYAVWKERCAEENRFLEPLQNADDKIRHAVGKYLGEQEDARRKAQRKAEEDAKVRDERETKKLLDRAEKARDKGDVEKAESLIEKAEMIYATPVFVASSMAKTTTVDGVGSFTNKTDVNVIVGDALLLAKAVVDKKVPVGCLDFKIALLKSWVKSAGIKNGEVPGLIIQEKHVVSVKGG